MISPWRGLDDVEFATMTYVDWFNHRRLHGEITDDATYTTPVEAETGYHRQTTTASEAVTKLPEQSSNPGRFRGAPEVVVNPGGVRNLWFHMPD